MSKALKIGVRRGHGDPEFIWNVIVLDLAHNEAVKFLTPEQYSHEVQQVQCLACEKDPTHSVTQTVESVEDFYELKDKGGPLGRINVRIFFDLDKPIQAIVILGAIFKGNNGAMPVGDKKRMKRRKRKYFAGDFGTIDFAKVKAANSEDMRGGSEG